MYIIPALRGAWAFEEEVDMLLHPSSLDFVCAEH